MSLEEVDKALKISEDYRNDLTEIKSLFYLIELAEEDVKAMNALPKLSELQQIELNRQVSIIEVLKRQHEAITQRVKQIESQ